MTSVDDSFFASDTIHDAIIIGAGPAGLSAALVLGRCRRQVVVLDSGRPRNAAAAGVHGFLTRDGTPPSELRRLARDELQRYPSITLRDWTALDVSRHPSGFLVTVQDQAALRGRHLLFATGREDHIPEKPGFARLLGRGVYHCPLCDGWEHRDEIMAYYAPGGDAPELAPELLTWTDRATVYTDGPARFDAAGRVKLAQLGITLDETPIVSLAGGDRLEAVCFADAPDQPCTALFFSTDCTQKSPLPARLGCRLDDQGSVRCCGHAAEDVPGVYVAGNVRGGIHLAIVAAAEGAAAAAAINDALVDQEIFPSKELSR